MQLGDYAEGEWYLVATCKACGRQSRLDPAALLAHAGMHRGMRLGEIESRLCCRDCHCRQGRIEPVARLRKQAFVAGMI